MEIVELTQRVKMIAGAVNIGLVMTSEGMVAVDTGLDKRAGKSVLKVAEQLGMRVCAIVNTHAHADHFGGNAAILAQAEVTVYAPKAEADVIRRPRFEPEYLWQGAAPFEALRNKFLLADASPVHVELQGGQTFAIGDVEFQCVPLPGHAHGQLGIRVDGVFFAADGYFDPPVVDKHGLPYMVNYTETLESAKSIPAVDAEWVVPGHGVPTKDASESVAYLVDRHKSAYAKVLQLVRGEPLGLDAMVQRMCDAFQLTPSNPGSWLLIRTTVGAYVAEAVEQGFICVAVDNGVLTFSANK
jgi:glyoxylase-like metal-dependent hydrolase (beta-lactamase superfamily II)